MGTIDSNLIAADLDMSLSDWGEEVIYTPKGETPRTITVLARRYPAEPLKGTVGSFAEHIDLVIKKHATEGTLTITVGGDSVTMNARLDSTAAKAWDIAEIVGHDAGSWLVRIYTKG